MRHIVPGLRKLEALKDVLLPLAGVICIIFPEHLTRSLPEGLGCVMLLTGILRLPSALREQEHKKLETMETAIAMVLIVLGVATLLMRHHALTMIGCTWGLFGVFKGTRILNHAIYNFTRKDKWAFLLAEAAFQIALGMLLLFHHAEKITMHIVILGIELLFSSVKSRWEEPPQDAHSEPAPEKQPLAEESALEAEYMSA